MNQKVLTKTFLMISNLKDPLIYMVYATIISVLMARLLLCNSPRRRGSRCCDTDNRPTDNVALLLNNEQDESIEPLSNVHR